MTKRLRESYETFLTGQTSADHMNQKLQSYLGILSHANQHDLSQALHNAYGVRAE